MIILQAILLGAVQGITEFLPISSSGHLVILHHFFDLPIESEMAFDVVLHFASLLAVILFFYRDILVIIKTVVSNLNQGWKQFSSLGWMLVFTNIPAVAVALAFGDYIENSFRSLATVAGFLIVGGALFLVAEKISRQNVVMAEIGWRRALFVGLMQPLALLPGISRSGITVTAGLFADFKRVEAVRFSFLLSIPIVLGAALKEAPVLWQSGLSGDNLIFLSVAFVSAFIFAFFAIKYLLKFVEKFSLAIFAYYRFVLAGLIILYLLWS